MSAITATSPSQSVRPGAARSSFLRDALTRVVATPRDPIALLLRLTLGLVMFPHGAQKVFGWFGGYGIEGTMGYFTGSLGIPALFAGLAIAAEFLGSLGLIAGLFTRVAAFGILSVMTVAAITVHAQIGFFMNWSGTQAGEGFEFHVLAGALALALVVRGGGALSLDRLIGRAAV